MSNNDAEQWFQEQQKEFMKPVIEYLTADEAQDILSTDCDDPNEAEAGWYCRLSAPGYLDCTDWCGPFKTEIEALVALYETFGE